MNKNIIELSKCRVCGSEDLELLLSLGNQPLTGVFIKPEDEDPLIAPLDLTICNNCKFVQLAHTIKPELMYSSYWYRSGINKTMKDHLKGVVDDVKQRVVLNQGDICIDIGCNDGTLLANYKNDDINRIGVDPSDAILSIEDSDITKINTFFSKNAVSAALNGRKAKIITSISMFYDIHEPQKFVDEIAEVLDENGAWILEMNYTGNMVLDNGYDMISHEHLAYYTLGVFERLLESTDLFVNDVTHNPINGGSIRLYVGFKNTVSESVKNLRAQEKIDGLDKKETYKNFALNIEKSTKLLAKTIKQIVDKGEKVCIYGASTRGNTILLSSNIDYNFIHSAAERNPLKYGLVTSGTRIPINSEAEVRSLNPEYLLILPYAFLDEFIEREAAYLNSGGKFIVPLPELTIISKINGELKYEIINN